jgi:hypothetical protein
MSVSLNRPCGDAGPFLLTNGVQKRKAWPHTLLALSNSIKENPTNEAIVEMRRNRLNSVLCSRFRNDEQLVELPRPRHDPLRL